MAEKPALAILIGKALAKKKGKEEAEGEAESHDSYKSPEEADARLQDIADDFLQAVQDKDSTAVKELLQEAFDCMMAAKESY